MESISKLAAGSTHWERWSSVSPASLGRSPRPVQAAPACGPPSAAVLIRFHRTVCLSVATLSVCLLKTRQTPETGNPGIAPHSKHPTKH
eukprot:543983-Amphidinium_carterae.1